MSDAKAAKKGKGDASSTTAKGGAYITTMALIMMNVTILAGIGNDVQQAFYGLSSVTYFAIGAIIFFIPTGLVAAELASGWSERGGIFRWVGEGIGPFAAMSCLLVLWMQNTFNFGSGIPSSAVTIGFFTTDFKWAVDFAESNHPWTVTLPIMIGWLVYYWVVTWIATKGVKVFAKLTKYGVLIGTFIPLAVMMILAVVWLAQGHKPVIPIDAAGLIPKWQGMGTLALVAGVLFSYAGIDMNAAYIKNLKNPNKQFPFAIFVSMILSFLIFVIGTVIIAIMIPESQINLLYTLNVVFMELGDTIGFPYLYLVFVWLGMANSFASLITNLAGPSYMLGSVGRSGFLPKILQNNNKHGMPSKLMYLQMALMTVIAFLVFFLPNVEGFSALVTQAITILYLIYYVLMFVAFLKLRHDQPNRPRGFRVPGGTVGAWIVGGVGIASCIFGIVLAYIPPAQLAAEVGSPVTYVAIITGLLVGTFLLCVGVYAASRKHDWVDPTNEFAPFTWQIEGMKKPGKALSNVPSEIMCNGQNPMGMPIKRPYKPDEMMAEIPDASNPAKQAAAAAKLIEKKGVAAPAPAGRVMLATPNINQVKTAAFAPSVNSDKASDHIGFASIPHLVVPAATTAEVAAMKPPADPAADEKMAEAEAAMAQAKAEKYAVEAEAYREQAKADKKLVEAQEAVKAAKAAAEDAAKAAEAAEAPTPKEAHPKAKDAASKASDSPKDASASADSGKEPKDASESK